MADAKLVVVYPRPKDVAVFEKGYQREHVPLAVSKLDAKIKIVATRILGSPQGIPPFYRIAEVHFPSKQTSTPHHQGPRIGPKKILVNSVLPGATDTEGFRTMPGSSDFRSVVVSQTPLGRLGRPRDIANVVSLLPRDEAAWITSQLVSVSGGWS